MRHSHFSRFVNLLSAAAAILLLGAAAAHATDAYDPASRTLSIPILNVGTASYSNVVLTVNQVVTQPHGVSADGTTDSWDPVSGQLTVQSVLVGGTTYFNAVVTVQGLVSIGAVAGADAYARGYLAAASVSDGNAIYPNVILAVSTPRIVSVNGGMPAAATDVYDPVTGHLTIPAVQVGSRVYTNVVITAGPADIVAVGPAVTLAQVQSDIFSARCAGCHNGSSSFLPGVQNLSSASATVTSLVGVTSLEQPTLQRVRPGDPNASYVIMKLEGATGISGARMPRGGPYLSTAQIEEVKSWIIGLAPP